jgi:hypothetical protein
MTDKLNKKRTTTLLIQKPDNYVLLSQQYRIERYIVPAEFRYQKQGYDQLHIRMKEQTNYPYLPFSYDKLDGQSRMVVYVLYPRDHHVKNIVLDFVSDEPLEHREIGYADIPFHMVVKLLQTVYFRGKENTQFVAQGKCYIFARRQKGYDICLQIEITGDRNNEESDSLQVFQVVGKATRFAPCWEDEKLSEWAKRVDPRFQRVIQNDQVVYNQLLPKELDSFQGKLYRIKRDKQTRPSVDFHDQYRLERGRGKILYDFTSNFIDYLNAFGVLTEHRWRYFHEHKNNATDGFALAKLGKVYLFDNRINKQTTPITEYLAFLRQEYPDLEIELLDDFSNAGESTVLLLQDTGVEDFSPAGILQNEDDPYKLIYHNPEYRHVPKQSININPNNSADFDDLEDYLDYAAVLEDESYQLRFDVCIHQLYLKQIVVRNKPAFGLLPGLSDENSPLSRYIFVRRITEHRVNYTVALYIENGAVCFLDLRDPQQKTVFYDLVDDRQIDWDNVLDKLCEQQFKRDPDQLFRFDVLITDGVAIEIEDIKERVLYDYEEIENRKSEIDDPRPISDFRLTEHYDGIKNANMYTRAEMESDRPKGVAKLRQSRELMAKFRAFDDFLDELAQRHMEMSYTDLVSGDKLARIAKIFDLKPTTTPDEAPKYNHAPLKRYYQKRNMFLSPKGKDVILYTGIWHDDQNCYLVGSPDGLKVKQDKGSVIRRFNVVEGDPKLLDVGLLLDTMAVKFVRKNRYTVYPYFFHLIRLFMSEQLKLQDIRESFDEDTAD